MISKYLAQCLPHSPLNKQQPLSSSSYSTWISCKFFLAQKFPTKDIVFLQISAFFVYFFFPANLVTGMCQILYQAFFKEGNLRRLKSPLSWDILLKEKRMIDQSSNALCNLILAVSFLLFNTSVSFLISLACFFNFQDFKFSFSLKSVILFSHREY